MCGKTEFIKKMLLNVEYMFEPAPVKIIYCYSAWQKAYDEMEKILGSKINFRTDIPSQDELSSMWQNDSQETLLILDDKLSCIDNGPSGKNIADIVKIHCHHSHVSCIITTQNLFHQSKWMREIALNTPCLCLFRNYRDTQQVGRLATQLMQKQREYFLDSYEKATSKNYGYLIVDVSPESEKKYQLRTAIFPEEDTIVYLPKK
jgi:hypothetical protein